MEVNQFVLICAVFIIIAGFMVSIPDLAPVPERRPDPLLICQFDSICAGIPCLKQPAPVLHVFPPGDDGWTLFSRTDRPHDFFRVARRVSEGQVTYYTLPEPGAVATEMTVSNSGMMRFEQKDRNGALIATGEGFCRQPELSGTATRNGDKV